MGKDRPIVIIGMPRSGTSMTAGIFHHHGVWVGGTRPGNDKNPKGYFENSSFKRYFQRQEGKALLRSKPIIPNDPEAFDSFIEETLKKEDYQGGPWLVKFSALWWRYFQPYSPYWVLVRRPKKANVDACMASNLHAGRLTREDLEQVYDNHHKEMDYLSGFNVYTQDVVAGDYSSLIHALESCGLKPDIPLIRDFVDPRHWHHRS